MVCIVWAIVFVEEREMNASRWFFGSTCREQEDILGAGKAACVGPQALRIADQIGAIFCAEDTMKVITNVCVRHSSRIFPRGVGLGDVQHRSLSSLRDFGGKGITVSHR